MSSQIPQVTQHIAVLKPKCTGTPTLTSWQISWFIHLQPVREIVGLHGKNKIHVALEDPRMSVLDCDPTSIHRPDQESPVSHSAMGNATVHVVELGLRHVNICVDRGEE